MMSTHLHHVVGAEQVSCVLEALDAAPHARAAAPLLRLLVAQLRLRSVQLLARRRRAEAPSCSRLPEGLGHRAHRRLRAQHSAPRQAHQLAVQACIGRARSLWDTQHEADQCHVSFRPRPPHFRVLVATCDYEELGSRAPVYSVATITALDIGLDD